MVVSSPVGSKSGEERRAWRARALSLPPLQERRMGFFIEIPTPFFLPGRRFQDSGGIFAFPAAFESSRPAILLPARPYCLPGRFFDLPDGHLAFRAAILARGVPSSVPAPSSS